MYFIFIPRRTHSYLYLYSLMSVNLTVIGIDGELSRQQQTIIQ